MNFIDFNQTGGFPLSTNILKRLQMAFTIFNALGNVVGDKTIISGCTVAGSNVADGVVFVNNEMLEFKGGVAQATVIIIEAVENLVFQNENSYPVVKTRYVTFGTGVGQMNWADFKRGYETKNIVAGLLGKADQSSFDALADAFALVYTKMLTIEEGAEVNVKPNYTETNPESPAFILNKPNAVVFLRQGVFNIADVADGGGSDELVTVTFPSIGTNNYMVIGTMISNSSNYNLDNDVTWVVREKANASFKLGLRELASGVQNLSFEYILIPMA